MKRYRALLRLPHVQPVLGAAIINVVAWSGGLPLAIILYVKEVEGSYATAGAVMAALALAGAASSPWRGRIVDRHGIRRSLLPLTAVSAAALLLMLASGESGIGPIPLVVLGGLVGAFLPPVIAVLRSLWSRLVPDEELRDSAYALQSVISSVAYLVGPALAAAAASASPVAGLLIVTTLGALGALGFMRAAPETDEEGKETEPRPVLAALRSSGLRLLIGTAVSYGGFLASLDVAAPALAGEHGDAVAGGLALTALFAGSLIGGLVYGARAWRSSVQRRYLLQYAAMATALVFAPLATSILILSVVLFVAGLALAPVTATMFALIEKAAVEGTENEATMWIVAAYSGGGALGSLAAGVLAQHAGAAAALAVGPAALWLGVVIIAVGQRSLASSQPANAAA